MEITAPGIETGALVGSQGRDRRDAPRMNRLREAAAPRSRRLQQITGRVLQLAERNPGTVRIVPPRGVLLRASLRSGIGGNRRNLSFHCKGRLQSDSIRLNTPADGV